MRPDDIDKGAFLLGYETGRRAGLRDKPRTIPFFKQIYLPDGYSVQYGTDSATISFVLDGTSNPYGVVLVPGLYSVEVTASAEGHQFQYGVCNDAGSLPTIITTGANRISYENGVPTEKELTISDPTNGDSFFIGRVFGSAPGSVCVMQISWGGQPPPLDALLTEDDEVMLTEDDVIIDAY